MFSCREKGDCLSLCLVLKFLILTSSLFRRLCRHLTVIRLKTLASSFLASWSTHSLMGWRDISQSKNTVQLSKNRHELYRVTMLVCFCLEPTIFTNLCCFKARKEGVKLFASHIEMRCIGFSKTPASLLQDR